MSSVVWLHARNPPPLSYYNNSSIREWLSTPFQSLKRQWLQIWVGGVRLAITQGRQSSLTLCHPQFLWNWVWSTSNDAEFLCEEHNKCGRLQSVADDIIIKIKMMIWIPVLRGRQHAREFNEIVLSNPLTDLMSQDKITWTCWGRIIFLFLDNLNRIVKKKEEDLVFVMFVFLQKQQQTSLTDKSSLIQTHSQVISRWSWEESRVLKVTDLRVKAEIFDEKFCHVLCVSQEEVLISKWYKCRRFWKTRKETSLCASSSSKTGRKCLSFLKALQDQEEMLFKRRKSRDETRLPIPFSGYNDHEFEKVPAVKRKWEDLLTLLLRDYIVFHSKDRYRVSLKENSSFIDSEVQGNGQTEKN